jgi:predicted ArsR family transcriptional regulator
MTMMAFTPESPPSKILAYLQRHGEATIRELEHLLEISTTAVREHLTHMEARGLIGTRLARQGPGRPKLVYSLRPRAHELFPKEYGTLIKLLLRELASRQDSQQLQSLLDAVGSRLAHEYGIQIGAGSVEERLSRLQTALAERGIPADLQTSQPGIELFACPYHDVAREHPEICAMERRMFEQILGSTVQLNGTIREGKRSCYFVVNQRPS